MLTIPRTDVIAGFDRLGVEIVSTVVDAASAYRMVRYVGLVR